MEIALGIGIAVAIVALAVMFGLYVFNFDNLIEKIWNKKTEIASDNRRTAEASLEEARIKANASVHNHL